jgi:hypothetical protein
MDLHGSGVQKFKGSKVQKFKNTIAVPNNPELNSEQQTRNPLELLNL